MNLFTVSVTVLSGDFGTRIVELERDSAGSLGLSIAGGQASPLGDLPIIVASLTARGPAARSGLVQVR